MNDNSDSISFPIAKIISAWAAFGVTSWSDFAAFVAAMYTCLLVAEFLWKKVFKPIAVARGWIANRSTYVGGEDAE